MSNTPNAIHHGRNVKRMRDVMGIKQEALAHDLGMDPQAVFLLEQQETLEGTMIEKICIILGVPEEMITHIRDESMINIFSGNFGHSSLLGNTINGGTYTFNPMEQLIEAIQENKKLYERLIISEKEKVDMLIRLIEGKK